MPRSSFIEPCAAERQLCDLVVCLLDHVGSTELGAEFERIESDCLFGDPAFIGGRGAVTRDPFGAAQAARSALAPLFDAIHTAPPRVRKAKDELLTVLDELGGTTAQQSLF